MRVLSYLHREWDMIVLVIIEFKHDSVSNSSLDDNRGNLFVD